MCCGGHCVSSWIPWFYGCYCYELVAWFLLLFWFGMPALLVFDLYVLFTLVLVFGIGMICCELCALAG